MKEQIEGIRTAQLEGMACLHKLAQSWFKNDDTMKFKNVPKGVRFAPTIKRPLRAAKADAAMLLLLLLLRGLLQGGVRDGVE